MVIFQKREAYNLDIQNDYKFFINRSMYLNDYLIYNSNVASVYTVPINSLYTISVGSYLPFTLDDFSLR